MKNLAINIHMLTDLNKVSKLVLIFIYLLLDFISPGARNDVMWCNTEMLTYSRKYKISYQHLNVGLIFLYININR